MNNNKTQVFLSYTEFMQRKDKSINGVSADFTGKNSSTNHGCWNCDGCIDCSSCEDCTGCFRCGGCHECDQCEWCNCCDYCNSCVNIKYRSFLSNQK